MPIVLGGTGEVGSFGHLGDLYARGAQHAPPGIVNLNPDRGGGGGYGGGGQVTDAQVFAQQAQQAAAQQHAELQNWLMQQDMTQHEQMRLQQQQNAVAQLNGAVDSGSLSRAEADQAIMQLRTGIDVGRQRMQATQQRMMQAQEQQMQKQSAAQEAVNQVHLQSRAAGFPDTVSVDFHTGGEQAARESLGHYMLGDEQPTRAELLQEADRLGHTVHWVQHRPGEWTQQEARPRTTGTGAHAGLPPGAMDETQWRKEIDAIEKDVNKADEGLEPEQRTARNQARRDAINQRAAGTLSHPDDLKKESDVPTYRSYLETRDPAARARRLEREGHEARISGFHDTRNTQINAVFPEGPERDQLRHINDMIAHANRTWPGNSMPPRVRQRIREWEASTNQALNLMDPTGARRRGQPVAGSTPRPVIQQPPPAADVNAGQMFLGG